MHLLQHTFQIPDLPTETPDFPFGRVALGGNPVEGGPQGLALLPRVGQLHNLLLQVGVGRCEQVVLLQNVGQLGLEVVAEGGLVLETVG